MWKPNCVFIHWWCQKMFKSHRGKWETEFYRKHIACPESKHNKSGLGCRKNSYCTVINWTNLDLWRETHQQDYIRSSHRYKILKICMFVCALLTWVKEMILVNSQRSRETPSESWMCWLCLVWAERSSRASQLWTRETLLLSHLNSHSSS